MLIGERWGRHSPLFLKLRECWSKDGHAAREVVTVYSVTFSSSNSILLLLVVGQIAKAPLPPPTESFSAHICWEAIDKFWNCNTKQ